MVDPRKLEGVLQNSLIFVEQIGVLKNERFYRVEGMSTDVTIHPGEAAVLFNSRRKLTGFTDDTAVRLKQFDHLPVIPQFSEIKRPA